MSTAVFVDFDMVLHRCCRATEKETYTVYLSDDVDRNIVAHCLGKSKLNSKLKELAKKGITEEDLDIFYDKEVEPLSHAKRNVEFLINSIVGVTDTDELVLCASGANNFRKQVDPLYKANRNRRDRPKWEHEITEWAKEKWDYREEDGVEADDLMGIYQTQYAAEGKDSIIATMDKDLDMIPGKHLNWTHITEDDDGIYHVDPATALRLFYEQLIVGDATDHIFGLFKMTGTRASAKIKEELHTLTKEKDLKQYVLKVWDEAYARGLEKGKIEKEFSVKKHLNTISQLLWIRRWNRKVGVTYK